MKIRELFVRYAYLMRIILVVFLILALSFTIIGITIINSARAEIVERSRSGYQEAVYAFSTYFDAQISILMNHAINLSFDPKIRRDTVEATPWGEIEAVTEVLPNYRRSVPFVDAVGVYYRGADYVLMSGAKHSLPAFIDRYGGDTSSGSISGRDSLEEILLRASDRRFVFFPVSSASGGAEGLIIGVQANLEGQTSASHNSLVFYYVSDPARLFDGFTAQYDALRSFTMLIAGEDGEILFCDDPGGSGCAAARTYLASGHVDQGDPALFCWPNESKGLEFFIVVPSGDLMARVAGFYSSIRRTMILALALITAVMALSVYFVYKPILDLKNKLYTIFRRAPVTTELGHIEQAFWGMKESKDKMQDTLLEQQAMLLDNALSAIIEGRSVRDIELDFATMDFKGDEFRVIALPEGALSAAGREALLVGALRFGDASLHILDLPLEHHIAAVLGYTNGDSRDALIEAIRIASSRAEVGVGSPVSSLNEIHESYLAAISGLFTPGPGATVDELFVFGADGEAGETDHLSALISNINAAQSGEALSTLAAIESRLKEMRTPMMRRYAQYKLLGAYMQACPLSPAEEKSLICFEGADEFFGRMRASVSAVCGRIAQERRDEYHAYRQSIVAFVDERYNDADISLYMVADHFNISIYTLSRVFREAAGVGFKEYVTSLRIERAKQLLSRGGVSVREVAEAVGFGNAAYFSQIFKSQTGVAPTKYK